MRFSIILSDKRSLVFLITNGSLFSVLWKQTRPNYDLGFPFFCNWETKKLKLKSKSVVIVLFYFHLSILLYTKFDFEKGSNQKILNEMKIQQQTG